MIPPDSADVSPAEIPSSPENPEAPHAPLYAVVNDHGRLRVLRVPVSHANERFFVLAAPYPLPNGTNKRIINRNDPVIPDSQINAVRYYLAFLISQRADNELMIQLWNTRIASAEKLLAEVEAGHDVLIER